MKLILLFLFILPLSFFAAQRPLSLFESDKVFKPKGALDKLMVKCWEKHNIDPSMISSDSSFLRRVYVDLIGTIPTLLEANSFFADKSLNKRGELIEQLLDRKEFAQY